MLVKNPPRSVTAHRSIGQSSRHRQSQCAEARTEIAVKNFCAVLLLSSLGLSMSSQTQADSLEKLADDFWTWRAKYAPFTGDDVNRMERPGGTRDWSRVQIENQRKDLTGFEARWKKIDVRSWPMPKRVDYRLVGSALSRVRWELDINPRWKRDPNFYIEQTLTPIVEALTVPGPYNAAQSREIVTRIENIPPILQQGEENLANAPGPFATVAAQALENIRPRLREMAAALLTSTTLKQQKLNGATDRAADALEKFRQWLQEKLPSLPQETALGRDAYVFFLLDVALLPYSPERVLAMGQQEWNRAVAFETYEKNRNKDVPPLKIADNIDDWIKDAAARELQIRKFLEERGILTVPNWVQHYTLRPMPEYLRALQGFGEIDDFTLEQAAKYLKEKVPMDEQTARQEAIAFATSPGGAISYQVGKLEIIKFLADARMHQGDKFNLRAFDDFVWKNGNVPIALQRWEYLGEK